MAVLSPASTPPVPLRYPVHVEADGPPAPSRWLWLVKWLLVIPHLVVLVFLWTAFAVLSVVAFVAILVTGRYPRGIFEFDVGVLRWSWRVAYYSFGALATDAYPPFTLAEVEDYPAHLDVDYPEHLSRGLLLVKWWLLALPHYLVVAVFVGTGTYTLQLATGAEIRWDSAGLIGLLVLIAAVTLAVTGSYPRALYDLLLGLNRWVIRVSAYAALMTDAYPPFRLDLGDRDDGMMRFSGTQPAAGPGAGTSLGAPPAPQPSLRPSDAAGGGPRDGSGGVAPGGDGPPAPRSSGAVATLVLGVVLLVLGGSSVVAGVTTGFARLALRDGPYVMSPAWDVQSSGYAVVTGDVTIHASGAAERWIGDVLGEVEVRATGQDDRETFLGITTWRQAEDYLAGVRHTTVRGPQDQRTEWAGGAPAVDPTSVDMWVAQSVGTGTQRVTVEPGSGTWVAVVMPTDGRPGVDAELRVGATLPWLAGAATTAVLVGLVLIVGGAWLVNSSWAGRPPSPVHTEPPVPVA